MRVIGFFDGGLPDVIALDKLAELPGGEEMLPTEGAISHRCIATAQDASHGGK